MQTIKNPPLLRHLQAQFDHLRANDAAFNIIVQNLQDLGAKAVVVGGWARDLFLEHEQRKPRRPHDIDVVTAGISEGALDGALPKEKRHNAFGGAAVTLHNNHLDIWRLESMPQIKHKKFAAQLASLPAIVPFRIQAIVFKPKPFWGEPMLEEDGFIEALHHRVIDFRCEYISYPHFQACRGLMLAARYDFSLSREVQELILAVRQHERWRPQFRALLETIRSQDIRQKIAVLLRQIAEGDNRGSYGE